MKLFIAIMAVLIISLAVVYTVTKGSPRPSQAEIELGLEKHLKYRPIRWDFTFGKETKTSNGIPAWQVIYTITTSSAGMNGKNEKLVLLYYLDGYDWKTEKAE